MFTREFLFCIRQKALRRGVWYKILDDVERGILSLTVKIVDKVKSPTLGFTLVRILKKLSNALRSGFEKQMEHGKKQAMQIAAQAMSWGNENAERWASDDDFIRYLTLLKIRTALITRVY
jgi:hypothetical protein